MAHMVESMVSLRETPWHGLGNIVQSAMTLEEGITESGLDWDVELCPLAAQYNGEQLDCSEAGNAVIRKTDKRVLGVVGNKWRPLQNREAFQWFAPFLESKTVQLETAGSLNGGRIVWVLARVIGGEAEVADNDWIRPYVLLSNSHDGSASVRVGFTPIRVVCWNTLSGAHKDKASQLLRVRHTKQLKPTLQEIQEIMKLETQEFQATAEQFRKLARRKINKQDLRKYVTQIVASDPLKLTPQEQTKIDEIERLALFGRGQDGRELTAWGAYNGVTEYLAWNAGRSNDTRTQSLWFGQGQTMSQQALTLALAL